MGLSLGRITIQLRSRSDFVLNSEEFVAHGILEVYLPEIATATQLRNLVEVSQENMRASLLPMESESLSSMTKSEEIITSPLTYNSGLSS